MNCNSISWHDASWIELGELATSYQVPNLARPGRSWRERERAFHELSRKPVNSLYKKNPAKYLLNTRIETQWWNWFYKAFWELKLLWILVWCFPGSLAALRRSCWCSSFFRCCGLDFTLKHVSKYEPYKLLFSWWMTNREPEYKTCGLVLNFWTSEHGTVIRTGISCKKIPL